MIPKIWAPKKIKLGKYKKRQQLHYYYIINNNVYKYICKNKNLKYDLKLYCSDSKCPAIALFNLAKKEFNPTNEDKYKHIEYESHSYVIPDILKEKFGKKIRRKRFHKRQ